MFLPIMAQFGQSVTVIVDNAIVLLKKIEY